MNDLRTYPSIDDVYTMYNDYYINFTLKNLLVSQNIGYNFISIDAIYIPKTHIHFMWEKYLSDPYINKYINSKCDLGIDIINNGYYWPFVVYNENDKYYIREGVHRLYSLKLCVDNKIIDKEYKVFCILLDNDIRCINPFEIYYPIEYKYCKNKVITDKVCKDAYQNTLENGKIVDIYTGGKTIYNTSEIGFCINCWPAFLRDLIYKYNNIKPNIVINDEYEYSKWIEI